MFATSRICRRCSCVTSSPVDTTVHRLCSFPNLDSLIEKGPPFEPQVIKDMLWAIDEEIGTTGKKDGATAQMLLVEKVRHLSASRQISAVYDLLWPSLPFYAARAMASLPFSRRPCRMVLVAA